MQWNLIFSTFPTHIAFHHRHQPPHPSNYPINFKLTNVHKTHQNLNDIDRNRSLKEKKIYTAKSHQANKKLKSLNPIDVNIKSCIWFLRLFFAVNSYTKVLDSIICYPSCHSRERATSLLLLFNCAQFTASGI